MLTVSDIVVNYGQSEVLHSLSFSAAKNEAVAIMGRNGMGKTTLFKSLMGILPLRSGRIAVDGNDLSQAESWQRVRQGIAYVPQGRMIFPALTVQENIETGLEHVAVRRVPEKSMRFFRCSTTCAGAREGTCQGGSSSSWPLRGPW